MVKPQQPELRRSDRGATSDDAAKPRLTAPHTPGVDAPGSRGVPDDNAPGHHPDHEQDKPSGREFVAKTHALAEAKGSASAVDRALSIAGAGLGVGFKAAGSVYREVRKRLPYSS